MCVEEADIQNSSEAFKVENDKTQNLVYTQTFNYQGQTPVVKLDKKTLTIISSLNSELTTKLIEIVEVKLKESEGTYFVTCCL